MCSGHYYLLLRANIYECGTISSQTDKTHEATEMWSNISKLGLSWSEQKKDEAVKKEETKKVTDIEDTWHSA